MDDSTNRADPDADQPTRARQPNPAAPARAPEPVR